MTQRSPAGKENREAKAGRQGWEKARAHVLTPYATAVAATTVATVLTLALWPANSHAIFAFYYLAVIVAAIYGHARAAILTVVLSQLVINFAFLEPYLSLALTINGLYSLSLTTIVHGAIILLIENLKARGRLLRKSEREQRELAEQLEAERARLLAAQAVSKVGSWETDLSAGTILWSAETYRIFEVAPDQFQPTPQGILELVHPEDRVAFDEAFVRSALRPSACALEHRLLLPDGRIKFVEERWQVIGNERGEAGRAIGTCQDITERRQAHDALQKEREFLAALVENVSDGIVSCDANGVLTLFNGATREFHGLPAEAIPSDEWARHFDLYLPDGMTLMTKEQIPLFRALQDGSVRDAEMIIAPQHGQARRILSSGRAFYDAQGEKLGAVVAMHDITGQRKAHEAIHRQAHMLDQIGQAVIATDTEGSIVYANRFAGELYGWTPEEMRGRNIMEVTVAAATREEAEEIMGRLRHGENWSGECLVQSRDGRVFPAWVTNSPLLDEGGRLVGIIGISKDISSRKQADAERDEMNRQLVDASRRAGMAEIATSVLHNVGNVLNSVNISAAHASDKIRQSCSADLTRVAALFQEHREDLPGFLTSAQGAQLPAFLTALAGSLAGDQHVALAELQSLSANIDHIKEIVAMQQSHARMAAVIEELSPASLVESAIQLNEAALGRHNVEVIREYTETPLLEVDKHKALQVLVNLIRNAKQAMAGVRADARRLTLRISSEDDAMVKIAVADAGVGIPAENLARLFEHGFTTRAEGHGFGLHSAALAAKELGGALTVHSDGPGKGAVFTLILPLHAHLSVARKL